MIGQTAPATKPRTATPRYSGKAILALLAAILSIVVPSPLGSVLAVLAMVLALAARSDLKADAQLRGTTLSLLGFLIGAGALVARILPWVVPYLLMAVHAVKYQPSQVGFQ